MAGDNTIIINTLSTENRNRIVPALYEPKRQNRFVVEFPSHFQIESFIIQQITRPKFELINGIYKWRNIEIDFIDLVGHSISDKLLRMVEFCKIMEKHTTEFEPLFTFTLEDLDPVGIEVGGWNIDVKSLILADFGENNYNTDDLQRCKLTLEPLACRLR